MKELSYGVMSNNYKYLGKDNVANIGNMVSSNKYIGGKGNEKPLKLPEFDEDNMEPKDYIEEFIKSMKKPNFTSIPKVSIAEGFIFIVNSKNRTNLDNSVKRYVVKVVPENFSRDEYNKELAEATLYRYSLIMGVTNEAASHKYAPRIHGFSIGIDEYASETHFVTDTFILLDYVKDGMTLQMLNDDFIKEYYKRETGMPIFKDLPPEEKTDLYYRVYTSVYQRVWEMHSHGIRHGNLSPDNIILRKNEMNESYVERQFIDFYPRSIFVMEQYLFPLPYLKLMFDKLEDQEAFLVEELVDILIGLFYHRWAGPNLPSSVRVMDGILLKTGEMSLDDMKARDGSCLAVIIHETYARVLRDEEMTNYFIKTCEPFSIFFGKFEETLLSPSSKIGRMQMFEEIKDEEEKASYMRNFFMKNLFDNGDLKFMRRFFIDLHDSLFTFAAKARYEDDYKRWGYTNFEQPVWIKSFLELMDVVY
jgi:serine/threonine protein kinase